MTHIKNSRALLCRRCRLTAAVLQLHGADRRAGRPVSQAIGSAGRLTFRIQEVQAVLAMKEQIYGALPRLLLLAARA